MYPVETVNAKLQISQPMTGSSSFSKGSDKSHGKRPSQDLRQNLDAAAADEDDGDERKKRRRRVVVACDTCRRKKVKCQGLPNPNSTCNNCAAYGYKCTFSADQDRSRGKYEILESKVDTLLAALQSVAPHLADDFSKGELSMQSIGGGLEEDSRDNRPPPTISASSQAANAELPRPVFFGSSSASHVPGSAPPGPRTGASHFEMNTMKPVLPPLASTLPSQSQTLPPLRSLGVGTRFGQLVPDLEDGRPRFFGKSSTFSSFHALDSRPPSPTLTPADRPTTAHKLGTEGRMVPASHALSADTEQRAGDGKQDGRPTASGGDDRTEWKVLPVPEPPYPTNSREWVHLIRRKNTVAIGRDDICTDAWATKYMLPAHDLVFHLLDDIFFPQLHPLLPILHPPTFRRDIQNGRANHDTAFRGLVFCVLTISSRFSNDPRVLGDPNDPHSAGDHWAAGSRLYHQAFAASLINVQVLLLTATFMHASIGPGSSWTILGVAIRALMDIGLHQERVYEGFKPFDQEMRRRTFWASFVLDCIFTICLGRPSALKLEDCNVNLPLDVTDEALSQSEASGEEIDKSAKPGPNNPYPATGFLHMAKLNLLVQDVVSTLYTPGRRKRSGRSAPRDLPGQKSSESGACNDDDEAFVDSRPPSRGAAAQHATFSSSIRPLDPKDMYRLSALLDDWVSGIPEHLEDPRTSPFKLQAGLMTCGRHDIRLYILKPFLGDANLYKSIHPPCILHARVCLQTVIDLYEGTHLNNMVFIFMQAFMSSVTFMLTVWHVTTDLQKLAEDASLIEKTARMMALAFDDRYCSAVFRKAWRVLQRVAVRAMPIMSEQQRQETQRWITANRIGGEVFLPSAHVDGSENAKKDSATPSVSSSDPARAKGTDSLRSQNHVKRVSHPIEHSPNSIARPAPGSYSFATGAQAGPYPSTSFGIGFSGAGASGPSGEDGLPTRHQGQTPAAHMSWQMPEGPTPHDHHWSGEQNQSATHHWGVSDPSMPSVSYPLPTNSNNFGDVNGILGNGFLQNYGDQHTMVGRSHGSVHQPNAPSRIPTDAAGQAGASNAGTHGAAGGHMSVGAGIPVTIGMEGTEWQNYFWNFLSEFDSGGTTDLGMAVPAMTGDGSSAGGPGYGAVNGGNGGIGNEDRQQDPNTGGSTSFDEVPLQA